MLYTLTILSTISTTIIETMKVLLGRWLRRGNQTLLRLSSGEFFSLKSSAKNYVEDVRIAVIFFIAISFFKCFDVLFLQLQLQGLLF